MFIEDSSSADTAAYLLWGHIISRSRYNPKFSQIEDRVVQEWKSHGSAFLQSWAQGLSELDKSGAGIKLTVEYKHKNYLRPNQRLKNDTLTYIISSEEINSAGQNPEILYNQINKKLTQSINKKP
jgi:hypothetical protein